MYIIKVIIHKDSNTVKYIKMIREFMPDLSMGGIKQRIEAGEPAFEFDLDANDWMYLEELDYNEDKWLKRFYCFLQELIKAGAVLELIEENTLDDGICSEKITMSELNSEIRLRKELSDYCEKYPD